MIFRSKEIININPKLSCLIPLHTLGSHETTCTFNNNKICFQSPIGLVVNSSSKKMVVLFSTIDEKNKIFLLNMKQVFKNLKISLRKKFKNIKITTPITEKPDNKFTFSLRNENVSQVYNYDEAKKNFQLSEKIQDMEVIQNSNCDFIIQVTKVIVIQSFVASEKLVHAFINCSICQIRQHDSTFRPITYLFEPCTLLNQKLTNNNAPEGDEINSIPKIENPQNTFISHPKLGIYFRMLQKKVPFNAVKQKVIMDKIDISILNYAATDVVPECFLEMCCKSTDNNSSILQEMENTKSLLKKAEIIRHPQMRGFNLGISLEDITARLFGLKKTNFFK
jgi:hypothetical protein